MGEERRLEGGNAERRREGSCERRERASVAGQEGEEKSRKGQRKGRK